LGREDILGKSDIPFQAVDIPEWGGTVNVRCMTGRQRWDWDALMYRINNGEKVPNILAQVAAWTLCDASGTRLFRDTDADKLGDLNGSALDRIRDVALYLSGVTGDARERAEGNSNETKPDSGTS